MVCFCICVPVHGCLTDAQLLWQFDICSMSVMLFAAWISLCVLALLCYLILCSSDEGLGSTVTSHEFVVVNPVRPLPVVYEHVIFGLHSCIKSHLPPDVHALSCTIFHLKFPVLDSTKNSIDIMSACSYYHCKVILKERIYCFLLLKK